MKTYLLSFLAIILIGFVACKSETKSNEPTPEQKEAQAFLDTYSTEYVKLYYASGEAAWKTNTEIKEGDTLNAYNSRIADEALTAFTGSISNIEQTKKFLGQKDKLTPLQVKQLEYILYMAGSDPQTVADLVK